ncbi:MAG TPA: peptide chain release factor 1 [Firmicutes bacterium]|nr:peptide chain release factor 1 [Bacillota bacterium]
MFSRLDAIAARYEQLGELLSSPETLSDMENWRALSRERAELEPIAEAYSAYKKKKAERDEALAEAEKETGEMRELLLDEALTCKGALAEMEKTLKVLLLPKDKNDERGCTLEIRAGAGGEEAALFAYDLYRMYQSYCEKHRFSWEVVDLNETELGGMKEAIVNIDGKGAYARLKYESGVHRVQRVPETESQGRIHTSTVTVAVLPEAEEVDVKLDEKDVRVDLFRSSGAGGQKVNKTETAIRLTHFPTGIVVTCQDERSQLKNKEKAYRVLRSRLYDYYNSRAASAEAANRKSLVGTGDRSERIRTYNFPQSRITDHRIGLSLHSMEGFLAGDLDGMIDALARADTERRLTQSADE